MSLVGLDGPITPEVGEALVRHAGAVPEGLAIVELGSYKGMSTCYLASATTNTVYAVDAWDLPNNVTGRFGFARPDTFQAFKAQTAAYPNIVAIKDYSTSAGYTWTHGPVGLLFVDADHSEKAVLADVTAWLAHLHPKGTVILDDWNTPRNPGVKRAAEKLVEVLGPYEVEAERLAVYAP